MVWLCPPKAYELENSQHKKALAFWEVIMSYWLHSHRQINVAMTKTFRSGFVISWLSAFHYVRTQYKGS
jgi:hypothetical protein